MVLVYVASYTSFGTMYRQGAFVLIQSVDTLGCSHVCFLETAHDMACL